MITEPFRHIIQNDIWNPIDLQQAADEFERLPEGAWHRFRNDCEHKDAMTFSTARDNGAEVCWDVRETFASQAFIDDISERFGIPGLQFDELGGGLHSIPAGGYLATHIDFNRDALGRYRRINVLLYLNHNWDDGPEGSLLLMNPDGGIAKVITPEFGRMVTFECSDSSWHGHPIAHPTRVRRSLAAYYFTDEAPADFTNQHDTVFQ